MDADLKAFLEHMQTSLQTDIRGLHTGLCSEMHDMSSGLQTEMHDMHQRFDKIEGVLNVTYEQVGQLTIHMTEVKNATDYIKHKITDHDEKLYLLNKRTKSL